MKDFHLIVVGSKSRAANDRKKKRHRISVQFNLFPVNDAMAGG
jgi:hypothetical protein